MHARFCQIFTLVAAFLVGSCTKHNAGQAATKPAPAPKAAPPVETKRIRHAQVAGSWYPGAKDKLAAYLDQLFAGLKPPAKPNIHLTGPVFFFTGNSSTTPWYEIKAIKITITMMRVPLSILTASRC